MRIPKGPARRPPGLGHGRGPHRGRDAPSRHPRDGRRVRRLVRPAPRPGVAGRPRPPPGATGPGAPLGFSCREHGRPARDGHGVRQDLPHRRQHDAPRRTATSSRSASSRRRSGQGVAGADAQRRGAARGIARTGASSRSRGRPPSAIACVPTRPSAPRCASSGRPTPASCCSGKVGMHTSPAYAEDVYIGSHSGVDHGGHRATFVVAVNAPGVTVLCRKVSARHANPFLAPLSSRFDELDGQMWLDDVLVPWERVFLTEARRPSRSPPGSSGTSSTPGWQGRVHAGARAGVRRRDGPREHEPTIEYLMDLVTDVADGAELPDGRRARPGLARRRATASPAAPTWPRAASPCRRRGSAWPRSCGSCPARRSSWRRRTRTWRRPRWRPGSRSRSAAAGTRRCSARRCSSWPPTTSPRRWTAASPPSSCTPTAASWPGARGCAAASRRYNELANGVLDALWVEMPRDRRVGYRQLRARRRGVR